MMSHLTSAWWGIPGHEVCRSDGTPTRMPHRPVRPRPHRCRHGNQLRDALPPPARSYLGRLPGSLDTRVSQSAHGRARAPTDGRCMHAPPRPVPASQGASVPALQRQLLGRSTAAPYRPVTCTCAIVRACCGHREALAAASQGCCGQQRTRCPGRLIGGVRPRGEVSKYFVHQSAKVLPHDVKYFISPDCR